MSDKILDHCFDPPEAYNLPLITAPLDADTLRNVFLIILTKRGYQHIQPPNIDISRQSILKASFPDSDGLAQYNKNTFIVSSELLANPTIVSQEKWEDFLDDIIYLHLKELPKASPIFSSLQHLEKLRDTCLQEFGSSEKIVG